MPGQHLGCHVSARFVAILGRLGTPGLPKTSRTGQNGLGNLVFFLIVCWSNPDYLRCGQVYLDLNFVAWCVFEGECITPWRGIAPSGVVTSLRFLT